MHLYLTGFMGAGKTSLGHWLSEALDVPFYDLDQRIEAENGLTIPTIFAHVGESGFRQMEQQALWDTLHLPQGIVATGGGTPCFYQNGQWMLEHGLVAYLDVPISKIIARLRKGQSKRPLIKDLDQKGLLEFVSTTITARLPFYDACHIIIHENEAPLSVFGPKILQYLTKIDWKLHS